MRTLRFLALPLLIAGVLLAAGCGGGSSQSVPNDAVAVVSGSPITKLQFASLIASAKASYAARKTPFPKAGTTAYKSLQDQAITYLVQESELEQQGKSMGIVVSDKDVQTRLTSIKKQYFGGSETKYQSQLKAQGLTEPELLRELKAQILSEKLYAKVTGNVKVTDAAVAAYYAAHKSTYSTAASRTVRHILVNNKTLADQLETQLKNGASFAVLAKKYSKDPGSASKGGKLTVTKGQTVPQFDKAAFSLKTGQTSAPVHSQYGWHIIQALTPISAAKVTPLKSVENSIRAQLLQAKKTTTMTNWVNGIKKTYAKKIAYQAGYTPAATSTSTTATTTTG
jgi:parvulin-like peptidyl-prolyl isomerase